MESAVQVVHNYWFCDGVYGEGDLDVCFESMVLFWVYVFLMIIGLFQLVIMRRDLKEPRAALSQGGRLQLFFVFCVFCFHVVAVFTRLGVEGAHEISLGNHHTQDIITDSVGAVMMLELGVILYLAGKHDLYIPGLARLCLALLFTVWALRLHTDAMHLQDHGFEYSFFLHVLECIFLFPVSAIAVLYWPDEIASRADVDLESMHIPPSAEANANFFSRLVFSWVNPVIDQGNRRTLTEMDLPELSYEDSTDKVVADWDTAWKFHMEEMAANKTPGQGSIVTVMRRLWGCGFLISGIIKVSSDILQFAGPLILQQMLKFIQDDSAPLWHGFALAAGLFAASELQSLILNKYFFRCFRLGVWARTALISAVYKKTLVLDNEARTKVTTGQITNLMSVDSNTLYNAIPYIQLIWSAPLQLIIGMVLLLRVLGVSVLIGLSSMIVLLPLNSWIGARLVATRKECMKRKDDRILHTTQVFMGIRVVKFFAWEIPFLRKIFGVRNEELAVLKSAQYLGALLSFLFNIMPLLVSAVSFVAYTLLGHKLDAATAFTALALFNNLSFPLLGIPIAYTLYTTAKVSIDRLNGFLQADEAHVENYEVTKRREGETSLLEVQDGCFAWPKREAVPTAKEQQADANFVTLAASAAKKALSRKNNTLNQPLLEDGSLPPVEMERVATLQDISFRIAGPSCVMICGPVGAGKSTLCSALLAQVDKTRGSITVRGSVAYCAQQAWIKNTTLKDNVLFGLPYNEARYREVLRCCALLDDLKILPAGDMTEIGERGINLSGGQKQRVSLARACYANADVVILDDPLSAVDAHVAQFIFENCVMGLLRSKLVFLVSHQIQFLPLVDHVILLQGGRIQAQGTPAEVRRQVDISALIPITENKEEELAQEELEAPRLEKSLSHRKSLGKDAAGDEKKGKLMEKEEQKEGMVALDVWLRYFWACGGAWMMLFIFALYITNSLSQVINNWWLAVWTKDIAQAHPPHSSIWYNSIYVTIAGCAALVVLLRSLLLALASLRASKTLHKELFERVIRTPMVFWDTTPVGRVTNRFSSDMEVIDSQLASSLGTVMYYFLGMTTILGVITYVTPYFAVLFLPLSYVYFTIQRSYRNISREIKRLDSVSKSPIFAHFNETINGVSCILAYNKEMEFTRENLERQTKNLRAVFQDLAANRWLAVRLEFLGNVVLVVAALMAIMQHGLVGINAGAVGLSLTYALQTTGNVNWLIRSFTQLETQLVAVERVSEYTELAVEPPAIGDVAPPAGWPARGEVEFRNLEMRYRENLDPVLKGISATIRAGEKIGVVGRTGAGKSSLINALFRMVECNPGSIFIDGVDISKIGISELRSKLSIIPQDPMLFVGTLRSNLDPFNEFTDVQLNQAIERCHLHDLVTKAGQGLDMVIKENGENLSVGQRQLLCLGRALLRESRILLMDEATASVDRETDNLIQATIRSSFADRTVITIAHRINTIMDSSRIMVMDSGYLAEFDSPQTLLANPNSKFFGLAESAASTTTPAARSGH
eukprot:gnl/Spiro4/7777_TR4091_c0_g1_i1.p1 gnl/Spiro4/7777_TR4091_c0_g1~~gnl/Spiro4/7777_TR4091_c0_g1_i1.p1  ORF type:complete len:1516 (+),score=565.05 gnl/Spiro4/7777_TR4091_c0_g1_i1:47-4594(+)